MTNELRAALYACKAILTRLQLIDDAPTSHIRADGQVTRGTASTGLRTRETHGLGVKGTRFSTSQVPEGVRMTGTPSNGLSHAPSKQFSLWAHYSWRMERAVAQQDAAALMRLAVCATRDYEVYTGKRPAFHENHEAAVTELLRDHTGVAAAEASWWLGAPEKWVRRQRVLNGRDDEFGEPVKRDALTERILRMKADGATTRAIAAQCNVSTGHVSNVVNGKAPATRAA